MDYHFNHTCHTDFASCKFLQSGIMNAPGEGGGTEDEGFLRARHTSVVVVKGDETRRRDVEFFANYGTQFRFVGVCLCHSCRPVET
jgi:hypothetical protein